MNKKLLNSILLLLSLYILFMIIPNVVKASEDTLNSIIMEINLDKNGTAKIVEKWDIDINSGTELFKQYNNLENSEVVNFSVSENGNKFQTLSTWNPGALKADKDNKCGINQTSAGVELCWGIGNFGRHEYVLEYEIENFIYEYDDSQVSNFILVPDMVDLAPKYVKITMNSFYKFDNNNIKVKISGFNGNSNINSNGAIEIYSLGTLKAGDYVNTDFTFLDDKYSLTNKTISLDTTAVKKSNPVPKKIFVTLSGVFVLFIIANSVEERRRKKQEALENNEETK